MQIFAGQVRLGIQSGQQNTSYADYLNLWQTAENLGYDWASVLDHLLPTFGDPQGSVFEGLSLIAALAARTSRLRCGILVASVTFRHPAVLAKMAATIDHISGGRLELGIGAGWFELEHQQYGIPLPPIGQRMGMLRETAAILKSLWTEQRTTFSGRYYTLSDALCEPKPIQQPHVPLWIGGEGEKLTLRVVAEHADGWNTFLMPVEAYRQKLDVLARHCRDVGRDPADVRKSLVFQALVGETEAEVQARRDRIHQGDGAPFRQAVVGTPEACVDQLLPFLRLGVSDFLVLARPPADLRTLELFASQVAPVLRAEGKRIAAVA